MLVLGQWLQYYLCILLTATAVASLNHTIDDQFGDSVTGVLPTYSKSPPSTWAQGATCQACYIHLDPSQVFQGTWHDITQDSGSVQVPTITVQFDGIAVYVYNILANYVPHATTTTNLSFTLDGEDGPPFLHTPSDSTDFEYNQLVFAAEGLDMTTHTFVMQAEEIGSVILFDYIVYVTEDPPLDTTPPSSTSSSPSSTSGDITSSTSSVATGISTSHTSSNFAMTTATSTSSSPVDSTSFVSIPSTSILNSSSTFTTQSPSSTDATILVNTSSSSRSPGTSQTSSPQSTSSNSTVSIGVVVGGAVAGVAVLFLIIILTLLLRRRRARASPYGVPQREKQDATGIAHAVPVRGQDEPDFASNLIDISATGTVSWTSSPRPRYQRKSATLPYTDSYVMHRASLQNVPRPELSMSPDLIAFSEGSSTYCEAIPKEAAEVRSVLPPASQPMSVSVSNPFEHQDVPSLRSEGNTVLHAQMAALREEMERLRERQEMQEYMLFNEAPPGYN